MFLIRLHGIRVPGIFRELLSGKEGSAWEERERRTHKGTTEGSLKVNRIIKGSKPSGYVSSWEALLHRTFTSEWTWRSQFGAKMLGRDVGKSGRVPQNPSGFPLELAGWCHTALLGKATVYSWLYLVIINYRFIVKLLQEVAAFWSGEFLFWKAGNNLCESDGAGGRELHAAHFKEASVLIWGLRLGAGRRNPRRA